VVGVRSAVVVIASVMAQWRCPSVACSRLQGERRRPPLAANLLAQAGQVKAVGPASPEAQRARRPHVLPSAWSGRLVAVIAKLTEMTEI
jgi:hypothetical protein